jgi:hypothetical protein
MGGWRRRYGRMVLRYGQAAPPVYGRGSLETTFRTVRAPIESPISASSAAACAAVPRMSLPVADSGRPLRGGVGGTPAGWAGWRRRPWRGAAPLGVAGALLAPADRDARADAARAVASGVVAARDVARFVPARVVAARFVAAPVPLVPAGPPFSFAARAEDTGCCAGSGDGRLSLRRCGLLRGSEPSTSEGRSSLNRSHHAAGRCASPREYQGLAKSEQDSQPPRAFHVIHVAGRRFHAPCPHFDFKKYSD